MTTDPLISRYLPVVNGHIMKNYRWIEERGNCLCTVEDLQQIAAIALIRLAGKWDEILAEKGKARDGDNALFWAYLKNYVKSDVNAFFRDHGKKGADDDTIFKGEDDETEDEMVRTSIRAKEDTPIGNIIWEDLVDFFELMPQKDKILIVLRYFDELTFDQMGDVLSANPGTTKALTSLVEQRWRLRARNMFTDYPAEETPRKPRPWDKPDSLEVYLQSRHRRDLSEHLWFATQCFRDDVSYLTDILGSTPFYPAGATEGRRVLNPTQEAMIDAMIREGESGAEIARRLEIPLHQVYQHSRRQVRSSAF